MGSKGIQPSLRVVEYIVQYAILQACKHALCEQSNALTVEARKLDPNAELRCSLHHKEHPITQQWFQVNEEQNKLVKEYERR